MEILHHFKTHTLPCSVRFQPRPQHFDNTEDSTLFLKKSQGTALGLAVCISLHYPSLQGTLQYFIPFSKKTYCLTGYRFGKHAASTFFPQDSVIHTGTSVHVPKLYEM